MTPTSPGWSLGFKCECTRGRHSVAPRLLGLDEIGIRGAINGGRGVPYQIFVKAIDYLFHSCSKRQQHPEPVCHLLLIAVSW